MKNILNSVLVLGLLSLSASAFADTCIDQACVGNYTVDTNGNYGTIEGFNFAERTAWIHYTRATNGDGSLRPVEARGPHDVSDLYVFNISGDCIANFCVGSYVVDPQGNYGRIEAFNHNLNRAWIHFDAADNGNGTKRSIRSNGYRDITSLTQL
jgi:hypothetical protein